MLRKLYKPLSFAFLAVFFWLVCVLIGSKHTILFGNNVILNKYSYSICLSLFTFFCFAFYRVEINFSKQASDLLDLLWKGFITSMIAFGLVFTLRVAEIGNKQSSFLSSEAMQFWSYHIYLAAIVIFHANLFYIFKNLSFYPKRSSYVGLWRITEGLAAGLLLYSAVLTGLNELVKLILILVFVLISLSLTLRLRWVVYLNFKQKVQAIFLILSVLLMGLFFLQLFLSEELTKYNIHFTTDNLFAYFQFTFLGIYSLFAILMLLFNLPTSNVFDRKLGEMDRFQQLSEALQQGSNEKDVIDQLLTGSVSMAVADAGWIEYISEEGHLTFPVRLDDGGILTLRNILARTSQELKKGETIVRDEILVDEYTGSKTPLSLLTFPLTTPNANFGFLVLVKYVKDGFEKDIINVLRMYTQQAAISLENMFLLSQVIEKERYQEEIKISKRVQQTLLPKYNLSYNGLKINYFTRTRDIVGGDFFDYCTSNGFQYWVAIGDVAGKGTAAAFLMAQLKGIFRALVQVCSGPKNLVIRANNAIAYNTQKSAFITLSVYLIDTELKQIRHVRGGHCQAIYYSRKEHKVSLLEPKGMGLGIVKDDSFKNYIDEDMFFYEEGDIMILYTDGVTEAKGKDGRMLGIESLLNFTMDNVNKDIEEIIKNFETYFNQIGALDEDDVTFMVIKFN